MDILHEKAAHTDGDSIVFFRHSDVISYRRYFCHYRLSIYRYGPRRQYSRRMDALNNLLDLAITKHDEEGGTYIIPGHGRLCDRWELIEYRDMVTIIRDRIQAMIKKGMTLDRFRPRRPDHGLRCPRYGADKGFDTTNEFVAAVYKSLGGK